MAKILLLAADGTEDLEFVATYDVLRRAGAAVTIGVVGKQDVQFVCSNGTKIIGDTLIENLQSSNEFECIVLPGGLEGAKAFAKSGKISEMLKTQQSAGRWIAAICASPALVLEPLGILQNDTAVAYPALMGSIKKPGTGRVHVSSRIITAVGPAAAVDFGLKIVERTIGMAEATAVAQAMLVVPDTHEKNV